MSTKISDYREMYPDLYDEEYELRLRGERIQALIRKSGTSEEYRDGKLDLSTYESPAAEAALSWAQRTGLRSGLYLFGPVGTGKTHLAQAAVIRAIHEWSTRARFIAASDLVQQARETNRDGADVTENELVEGWTDVPFLAIDDLGSERATDYSIQVLFRVLDRRVSKGRPTMITSNFDLGRLGDRLAPAGKRDDIEAKRILDRIAGHCELVEVSGKSHRRGKSGVGKVGLVDVEGPRMSVKGKV